jgi:hypothetical protein
VLEVAGACFRLGGASEGACWTWLEIFAHSSTLLGPLAPEPFGVPSPNRSCWKAGDETQTWVPVERLYLYRFGSYRPSNPWRVHLGSS